MQVKTTMRKKTPTKKIQWDTVWMAIIKKVDNNRCWWGYREMGTPIYCWWKLQMVQPLWITVWHFHRRLNIRVIIWLEYILNLEWQDLLNDQMKCEGKRRQKWLLVFWPRQQEIAISWDWRIIDRTGLQWKIEITFRHAWFDMSIRYTKWRYLVGSLCVWG